VFVILSQYQMKLNPSKCVFTIKGGKKFSFLVSSKKIEPNPKQNSSSLQMKLQTTQSTIMLYIKKKKYVNYTKIFYI
jgi:hypothetical protein